MLINYHQDPGHGWLQVSRTEAKKLLGPDFKRISPYSYQRGSRGPDAVVFLEEDCDAGLLLRALERAGIQPEIIDRHSNTDSFIRNLPSFRP